MKVSIIGAGRVGATAAFYIATQLNPDQLDELALVDIIPKLAEGQALDITHALHILGKGIKVTGSEALDAVRGSDVIVITAGKARDPGMTRMELLRFNATIVSKICESIPKLAPHAVLILVTNPVDVLTYLAWKKTGFLRERVFGVGNLLDTGRLRSLGHNGIVIGQHGEFLVPLVGNPANTKEKIKKANNKVIEYKKGTEFGPAVEIGEAVKAVLLDSKVKMPVSAVLQGEYGLKGLAIGVPALVGKGGISKIIEMNLTKEQRHSLNEAANAIQAGIKDLGLD